MDRKINQNSHTQVVKGKKTDTFRCASSHLAYSGTSTLSMNLVIQHPYHLKNTHITHIQDTRLVYLTFSLTPEHCKYVKMENRAKNKRVVFLATCLWRPVSTYCRYETHTTKKHITTIFIIVIIRNRGKILMALLIIIVYVSALEGPGGTCINSIIHVMIGRKRIEYAV